MLPLLWDGVRQLLYPSVCRLCRVLVALRADFCDVCTAALTSDDSRSCPRCCSSVGEYANISEGCPRCRGISFHFDEAFRFGIYDGVLRDAILAMKYQTGEDLARALARLWFFKAEERLRAVAANFVVPIPLHRWRRWRRGYNQSEAVARMVAELLGLPLLTRPLYRTRSTRHQADLNGTARAENVKGAFAWKGPALPGSRVLLIDDVLTTGSTASEAAKVLRKAGASAVVVAVLAHR